MLKWLKSVKKPSLYEYIVLGLLFLIPFASIMYGDTKAFVHYEVNFWNAIFHEGGLRNFYEYSYFMEQYYKENGIGGAFAAYYDFPVFILFGIWGFPLWIVCQIFHLEETSTFTTMLYGKTILLIALIVSAFIIYKICKNIEVSESQANWASFLFLSSAVIFAEVGLIGQLDVMGFPFILLGIYFFQERCNWKFVLMFMIASSFKQFPFFIFVPLLLLIEKNILKIGLESAVVLAFSKIIGLFFPTGTMAIQVKQEFGERSLERLLGVKLPLYNDTVPAIVVVFGIICVYCYLKNIQAQRELEEHSIYIPLIAMTVLLCGFDSDPYWFVHLAPYVAIMLVYNSSKYKQLILFETVGMICLILNQFGANYWCFEPWYAQGMLMDKLLGQPDSIIGMETFIGYTRLDRFSGVFFAGFVVCLGAFLWISRPGHIESDEVAEIRPYAWLRMITNAGIGWIPVLLYMVSFVINM